MVNYHSILRVLLSTLGWLLYSTFSFASLYPEDDFSRNRAKIYDGYRLTNDSDVECEGSFLGVDVLPFSHALISAPSPNFAPGLTLSQGSVLHLSRSSNPDFEVTDHESMQTILIPIVDPELVASSPNVVAGNIYFNGFRTTGILIDNDYAEVYVVSRSKDLLWASVFIDFGNTSLRYIGLFEIDTPYATLLCTE